MKDNFSTDRGGAGGWGMVQVVMRAGGGQQGVADEAHLLLGSPAPNRPQPGTSPRTRGWGPLL